MIHPGPGPQNPTSSVAKSLELQKLLKQKLKTISDKVVDLSGVCSKKKCNRGALLLAQLRLAQPEVLVVAAAGAGVAVVATKLAQLSLRLMCQRLYWNCTASSTPLLASTLLRVKSRYCGNCCLKSKTNPCLAVQEPKVIAGLGTWQ